MDRSGGEPPDDPLWKVILQAAMMLIRIVAAQEVLYSPSQGLGTAGVGLRNTTVSTAGVLMYTHGKSRSKQ